MAGAYGRNFAAGAGAAAQEPTQTLMCFYPGDPPGMRPRMPCTISYTAATDTRIKTLSIQERTIQSLYYQLIDTPKNQEISSLCRRTIMLQDMAAAKKAFATCETITGDALINQIATEITAYIALQEEQATFSLPPAGTDLAQFLASKGKLLTAELDAMVKLEAKCAAPDLDLTAAQKGLLMRLYFDIGAAGVLKFMEKYKAYPSDCLDSFEPIINQQYLDDNKAQFDIAQSLLALCSTTKPDTNPLTIFDTAFSTAEQQAMAELACTCNTSDTPMTTEYATFFFEEEFGTGHQGVLNFRNSFDCFPSQAANPKEKTLYRPFVNKAYLDLKCIIQTMIEKDEQPTSFNYRKKGLILLPASITHFKTLKRLDLSNNDMQIIPQRILSQLNTLNRLKLTGNHKGIRTRALPLLPAGCVLT